MVVNNEGSLSQGHEDVRCLDSTAQHLANIVFLSYRYSQGGIGTQTRMLLFLEENFHPDLLVSGDQQAVRTLTHRMVGRYFLNQSLHPATAIPWEDESPEAFRKSEQLVTNELAGLFGRFEDRAEIATFSGDVVGIAQSVIVMDTDYLARAGGRGGGSDKLMIRVDNYTRDPHDSLFIKHAVLGRSTNTIEYDAIFSCIGSEDTIRQFDQYTLHQLQFISDTYLETHQDAAIIGTVQQLQGLCMELLDGR
jgi:hypothetical protein